MILARRGPEKTFLLRLMISGLLIRMVVGTVINVAHLEEFFEEMRSLMTRSVVH